MRVQTRNFSIFKGQYTLKVRCFASDHRYQIKAGQARAGAVRRSKEGKRATGPLGAAYVPEMKRPKLSFPSQAEQPFPRSRVRYRRHARLTLPFKREAEPGRKFGADPELVVKC